MELEYDKLVQTHGIDCDFVRVPAYLYLLKEKDARKKEAETVVFLGIPAKSDIDEDF